MAYENLNDAEKALDSFYDALLIQGDHSERLQFYSQQMRMKSLPKQIFGLSGEQNRHLYKVYRNMKVELG